MNSQILKRLACVLVCASVVASCASTPSGRPQLVLKSEAALEIEATRQFNSIRDTAPLVKDRATIDYVACVTNAIIDVLEGADADLYWELAIVDHPMVNAQAMAGGKVIVYSGILPVTANQDQLAAVIGHEIAHVTAHHTNEKASRQSVTGVGIDIAAALLGGGYAQQTNAARGALSQGAIYGILYPFSRKMESEADIIGLEYMAMAGFDPRESANLWQRMDAKKESRIPAYMTTHPSSEDRIDGLVSHYPKALALYNKAQAEGRYPDCQR
mgnify:FL=1